MINLFLDTNVWLSLYTFTKDDLEKFKKLNDYLKTYINLYYTEQVNDELIRNRESRIKDGLESLNNALKPLKFPAYCKEYDIYKEFCNKYKELGKEMNEWLKEINKCIETNSLPADKALHAVLDNVVPIPCKDYIDVAKIRYNRGNPPGKKKSYGDAINWECLLDKVPEGEDLYFISTDTDFSSDINKEKMNPFLYWEWKSKKKSEIHFYTSLTAYLNDNIKGIELITENEKEDLILQLENSSNYVTTHGIIAMLRKYSGWTKIQIEKMCSAALTNSQVNWILSDSDIKEFFMDLLSDINYKALNDCYTKKLIDAYYSINFNDENYYLEQADDLEESNNS